MTGDDRIVEAVSETLWPFSDPSVAAAVVDTVDPLIRQSILDDIYEDLHEYRVRSIIGGRGDLDHYMMGMQAAIRVIRSGTQGAIPSNDNKENQ